MLDDIENEKPEVSHRMPVWQLFFYVVITRVLPANSNSSNQKSYRNDEQLHVIKFD